MFNMYYNQILIFLCLLSSSSSSNLNSTESVDMIEFNTIQDFKEIRNKETRTTEMKLVKIYEQMIIWEWNEEYRRYDALTFFVQTADEDKYSLITQRQGVYTISVTVNKKKIYFKTKKIKYSKCLRGDDPERLSIKLLDSQYRRKLLYVKEY